MLTSEDIKKKATKPQRKKLKKAVKKLKKLEKKRAEALSQHDVARDKTETDFNRKIEKKRAKIENLHDIIGQQPDRVADAIKDVAAEIAPKKKGKKKKQQ